MTAGLKLILWRIRHVAVAVMVGAATLAVCALALLTTLITAPPLHRLRR